MALDPSSVEVFPSAAVRDEHLTAPRVGQCVMLVDTGAVLFYYGVYLGWRPAWNTPWGKVARTRSTTSVTVSVPLSNADWVEITGVRTNLAAVAYRQYRLDVEAVCYLNGGTGADNWLFQIYDGTRGLGTGVSGEVESYTPVGSIGTWQAKFSAEVSFVESGADILRVSSVTSMPFGAIQSINFAISDVGSAGAPLYP